jgi:RNA polymerase sigma factor
MILNFIKDKKMLPVKEITLFLNVNRKFVEKWRRYLITLILILSNENYPYIKSYLNIKAGDKLG